MQEKLYIPWKKIILASTISILLIFFIAFIVALLSSYYLITVKMGNFLMFAALFIGNFIGCFFVKSPNKRIMYVVISTLLTFLLLQALGLLMPYELSLKNTAYVFAVLLISSIVNGIVKAMLS